jgi:DNA sulfur modification protein DndC
MNVKKKIREIQSVLSNWSGPIVIAYSGGKDSSAVVKLVLNALRQKPNINLNVQIVYCDTGVENPIIAAFVKDTLASLSGELLRAKLNCGIKILSPDLNQRFFVRIIGRGYPPPTQFFRWCTKDLRIRPVQRHIKALGADTLVVVGTRKGESAQRDRTIKRSGGNEDSGPLIQRQLDGGRQTSLYLPIVELSFEEVWETLSDLPFPRSIDIGLLADVYRHGGGECPIVRDVNDKPCSSARFGCWTCTVVRRDKSAEGLLNAGYVELKPYFEFRGWLATIRNDPKLRCEKKRNGKDGPGPFTLEGRRLILERLYDLETATGKKLLNGQEVERIFALWHEDRTSNKYMAMEAVQAA